MITPFFQLPPRPNGASQIVIGPPPARRTFFNFPSAKKAIQCPSGDQKGKVAPSLPSTGSADNLASAWFRIVCFGESPIRQLNSEADATRRNSDGVSSKFGLRPEFPHGTHSVLKSTDRVLDLKSAVQNGHFSFHCATGQAQFALSASGV